MSTSLIVQAAYDDLEMEVPAAFVLWVPREEEVRRLLGASASLPSLASIGAREIVIAPRAMPRLVEVPESVELRHDAAGSAFGRAHDRLWRDRVPFVELARKYLPRGLHEQGIAIASLRVTDQGARWEMEAVAGRPRSPGLVRLCTREVSLGFLRSLAGSSTQAGA